MAKREYRQSSEECKMKQSIKKQGILNPMANKPRSEETKKLISDKLKQYWSTIPNKNDVSTTQNSDNTN